MIGKKKKYTLAEAIDLYDDFDRSRRWARVCNKINTALPKKKAEIWDAREKEANDYLDDVEKRMIEAVDSLNEEDMEKFRRHYGI